MKKSTIIILDILIIAIMSVLSFGIFPITDSFILSYSFLTVATLMQIVSVFVSEKVKDTVYKTAVYSSSAIYFFIQLIVSLMGYITADLSLVLISSISLALLLLNIVVDIIAIHMGVSFDKTKSIESRKLLFIDNVIYRLEKAKSQSKDSDVITMINNVIEKVRYSNSNSVDKTAEIEFEILQEIENIEKLALVSKTREIKNACEKLISLFTEREMLCKLYK